MSGPLYTLLIKLGVPATIAAALVGALMLLGGCAGEQVTVARVPNIQPVPVVVSPSPVPQK